MQHPPVGVAWTTTSIFRAYEDSYAPGCVASAERGNDRVYRVSVPPGQYNLPAGAPAEAHPSKR